MKNKKYLSTVIFIALLLLIIFNQIKYHNVPKSNDQNHSPSPVSSQQSRKSPHVSNATFPDEARQTYALILNGGPFPYRQDGVTFYNREKRLPDMPRNYYREYTVKTPSAGDRGARRIVCGGKMPKKPDICYYTPDHYRTFTEIHHETFSAQ